MRVPFSSSSCTSSIEPSWHGRPPARWIWHLIRLPSQSRRRPCGRTSEVARRGERCEERRDERRGERRDETGETRGETRGETERRDERRGERRDETGGEAGGHHHLLGRADDLAVGQLDVAGDVRDLDLAELAHLALQLGGWRMAVSFG